MQALTLALFIGAMIGVLLARSVAAFVLAWESMSLVSTFLVAAHHEQRSVRRAVLSYAIMSQFGTLFIIAALVMLAEGSGHFTFTQLTLAAPALAAPVRVAALTLASIGFASKAGIVPLHFWLPRAHPAAQPYASALLSGLMLAVALYGFANVALDLAAPAPPSLCVAIIAIGALTACAGGLYAALQSDLKRLLAYSSVENVGILAATLGLAMLATACNVPAIAGLALLAFFLHVAEVFSLNETSVARD